MRDRRIRTYAGILLAFLLIYAIWYPLNTLPRMLDFAFFEPNQMRNNWLTNGYVTDQMRWTWLGVWILPILAGTVAAFASVWACYLCWKGRYFHEQFGLALIVTGFSMSLGMVFEITGNSLSRWILTLARPDGKEAIMLRYNSEELGILLCGMGFCALGLLISEAAKIARENEAFV